MTAKKQKTTQPAGTYTAEDLAGIYGVTVGRFRSCRLLLTEHPQPVCETDKPHLFSVDEINTWLLTYNPIEAVRAADVAKRKKYNRLVSKDPAISRKATSYQRKIPMAQGVPNIARLW